MTTCAHMRPIPFATPPVHSRMSTPVLMPTSSHAGKLLSNGVHTHDTHARDLIRLQSMSTQRDTSVPIVSGLGIIAVNQAQDQQILGRGRHMRVDQSVSQLDVQGDTHVLGMHHAVIVPHPPLRLRCVMFR